VDQDRLSALRILIVDDQSHVRDWVRGILGGLSITEVREAADGRTALAAVTAPDARFDLVLTDLHMPQSDGIEFIRAMAQAGIDTAVAIMSVEDERVITSVSELGNAQGVHVLGIIHKPLTAEKLEPILERLLAPPVPRETSELFGSGEDPLLAIERREFIVQYQPRIACVDGRLVGAVPIVRWQHPRLGLLSATQFSAAFAAFRGHSELLAQFALEETVGFSGRLQALGRPMPLVFEIAGPLWHQLELPDRLEALADARCARPEMLTIGIPERLLGVPDVPMLDIAMRLRLKGFGLAVNEFGSGHAGIPELERYAFSELAISDEFVDGCSSSASKRAVVEATIAVARSIGMRVVASGVRLGGDADLLTTLGCDAVQGPAIARPMSEERLLGWMSTTP
jgi:EAL domain-containing protein (putative c-di-GMP-specific phosphodiesterase class I)/DNA-binding NarL/FixJ family response regulator